MNTAAGEFLSRNFPSLTLTEKEIKSVFCCSGTVVSAVFFSFVNNEISVLNKFSVELKVPCTSKGASVDFLLH